MPDLSTTISTIIQVFFNHITIFAAIIISICSLLISIYSFYYGRKPLIHITFEIIDTKFPTHKPVDHEFEFIIKNVSQNPAKIIETKVKLIFNKNPVDIGEYKLNYLNPEAIEVIKDLSKKIVSKLENLGLSDKKEINCLNQPGYIWNISEDFKINIDFEITCEADIPFPTRINKHKFQYNFEISYIKGVNNPCSNNYTISIKPSNGYWK